MLNFIENLYGSEPLSLTLAGVAPEEDNPREPYTGDDRPLGALPSEGLRALLTRPETPSGPPEPGPKRPTERLIPPRPSPQTPKAS